MLSRRLSGISAILLGVLLVWVSAASSDEPVLVSQRNRQFMPDDLHVARGTVVHVTNDDKVTHHVYIASPDMKFDSGEQPVGTTVDLKFDQVGTFAVQCAIRPTMHLQVTVE